MRIRHNVIGSVRRSQLITTYGVGALIPVEDQSVMVAGLERWPADAPDIHEPRLERRLDVRGFVRPPATGSEKDRDIPVVRFPLMYSCPECHRLDQHYHFCDQNENKCNGCERPLVPSRFIIVCSKGHIDDFPYFEWVHSDGWDSEKTHKLSIEAAGVSASLRDVVIQCSCGKSRSMEGAFGRDALRGVKRCQGKRPWLFDEEPCGELPRTLQRGASNVYFPVTQSALSIPPWSEGASKFILKRWDILKHISDSALQDTIRGIASESPYKAEDLLRAVMQKKAGEAIDEPTSSSLRAQEYEALCNGKPETSSEQDFVCVPVEDVGGELDGWFDKVMAVKRLREVRALVSFTRLLPPSPDDSTTKRRAPISKQPMDWLPAIEVLGEGVFLRLDQERLREWEADPLVQARAAKVNERYEDKFQTLNLQPDRPITPRLLLIHSLAHALINQWSLDCGYPAGSLRERLYVGEESSDTPMAGLLIYTATTDAAGSLGGVVAQAESDKLIETLQEAIERTSWCSADPLCIEADAAGVDSLNLAACHACILLPEVSCEESNILLDRGMLVGTPEHPDTGFFSSLYEWGTD